MNSTPPLTWFLIGQIKIYGALYREVKAKKCYCIKKQIEPFCFHPKKIAVKKTYCECTVNMSFVVYFFGEILWFFGKFYDFLGNSVIFFGRNSVIFLGRNSMWFFVFRNSIEVRRNLFHESDSYIVHIVQMNTIGENKFQSCRIMLTNSVVFLKDNPPSYEK